MENEEDALYKRLQETLDSDPDNPTYHYDLGIFLWEKGGESKEFRERAVEHFVASAKLNPSNGATFRFLGHYYSQVSIDPQRASKCYQRAVTLNPNDFESGEGLCNILDNEGKENLEVAVCREASQKSPRAFWAFRRLGYLQVHQKKWSEAVQSLQHAIRGYPTCADLWEALGLAYQRLGMFTAALKSYGRAIELEGSRIFALVESGNILLMLGSYTKAVEQFRHALEIEPQSIAALYGLASGLLGLSKDCVNSGAFTWGASLLEEATAIAKSSTCLAGNVSSTWKLHGDIQIAYSKCFPWADEDQRLGIDEDSLKASVCSWKRKRLVAAVCASRSYQRALHLTPWQANIYTDIAISLDFIYSLEERNNSDLDPEAWQLPEKMSLGGLMLEGDNSDFWVVLGCLSTNNALKQHAFIRGLQLDVSLAVAWAHLGLVYRKEDEKLAKQAFDHARSIDPSLALPWAGMSIDTHTSDPNEAYESCLRAVHILPLAELQVGLGMLAVFTGQLLSPQVFGALHQAVQHAPECPESHNLFGLACEARSDYQSAVAAYRRARYAIGAFQRTDSMTHKSAVLFNLARSLCQAGNYLDAARECEDQNNEGLLDSNGLHIYIVALWQLGKNDLALSLAGNLASNIPAMDRASGAASVGLICKLLYWIFGPERAAADLLKMPLDFLQSSNIRYIVPVLFTLDQSGRLQSLLPSSIRHFTSYEEVAGLHSLLAVAKLVKHGSGHCLGIQNAVDYLRKILHMYPNSTLIRNHLCSLLLASKEWKTFHAAIRCVVIEPFGHPVIKDSKSAFEIVGSAAVACYSSCTTKSKYSFPTCKSYFMHGAQSIRQLQKWLHQEPWNYKARYLLILNVLQKAREEWFPQHLCVTIKRLLLGALSSEHYSKKDRHYEYQKFQLLLCASEISMQGGDYLSCISHATDALRLPFRNDVSFFAHLQLCRAYSAQGDLLSLKDEFEKCMNLRTDYEIGWISLKFIESRCKQHIHLNAVDRNFEACLEMNGSSRSMWMALMDFVRGQCFIWEKDFVLAEQALAHGCSIWGADSCLFLCHGAICMELARQRCGSQFLSLAVSSLTKALESTCIRLPIVFMLLAQAEASLGSRKKWERNLSLEWYSWPAEMRPAELYFQMHLLARQSTVVPDQFSCVKSFQSPQRLILRAIHLNPSCSRYWKVLQKVVECE